MTIAPAPFVIDINSVTPVIIILSILLLIWAAVEFYIGLSRPCEGLTPSHLLIKIDRMIWPFLIIYSWLDFSHHWTSLVFPAWINALLISSCILSLVLRVWAVVHLGESFSYDVKKPEGEILVTTGPYRIIRHPAYLAVCVLGSFPGLILGSIPGFVGMLAATSFIVVCRINAEEKILEKEYGDIFIAYKRRSHKLIPFIY